MLATQLSRKEQRLQEAREMHAQVVARTRAAGITEEDIRREVRKAFEELRQDRRSNRTRY